MITCPYCFGKFEHDQVHFRSERATVGLCDAIPSDYDDFDDFVLNYRGADKESILAQCQEWEFFREGEDKEYARFWKSHGGTTTEQISRNKASYRRRVINPADSSHRRYLKVQDQNGGVLRYQDGFVTSIRLNTGELCTQRVCPYCHNPLPNQYGRHETRFIAVIGVTGAGKTVYLSQLIRGFDDYVVRGGLASLKTTDSPMQFLNNNPINTRVPLPGSTPPGNFLQPLFYDLSKTDESGRLKVYTLVIYDVAGENCSMDAESWFGEFIGNMHGVFLLIDPVQFRVVQGAAYEDEIEQKGRPSDALQALHHYISGGSSGAKCEVPLAVCISKSDMEIVQDVMGEELADALQEDVEPVYDAGGNLLSQFNAKQYNPIAVKLHDFIKQNELALEQLIGVNYACYNYFAFTSLGCGVDESGIPEGPILPRRIEEPLLWLFHNFGFIGSNDRVVDYGAPCPHCKSTLNRRRLYGEERIYVTKKSLFGKVKEFEEYDYYCDACDQYYNV